MLKTNFMCSFNVLISLAQRSSSRKKEHLKDTKLSIHRLLFVEEMLKKLGNLTWRKSGEERKIDKFNKFNKLKCVHIIHAQRLKSKDRRGSKHLFFTTLTSIREQRKCNKIWQTNLTCLKFRRLNFNWLIKFNLKKQNAN